MRMRNLVRILALALMVGGLSRSKMIAWDVSINGRPGSDLDDAAAVAVDPDTGSIFVAGTRQISPDGTALFLEKFTSRGDKEWQERIEGAKATAVAIDAKGYVYVGGDMDNTDSGSSSLIVKLDGRSSRKHVMWQRAFNRSGESLNTNAIALTPDGGLAVVGSRSYSANEGSPGYLMKFTGEGQDAWPAPWLFPTATRDGARGVAVLPNGDFAVIVAVGDGPGPEDSVLGRFNGMTGEPVWTVRLDEARLYALTVADNGDILLAGAKARMYFSVYRYNEDGARLWMTTVNPDDASPPPFAIATTRDGNIVAAGYKYVASLDSNGRVRWSVSGPRTAATIAFDSCGNPVITGTRRENAGDPATFSVIAFDKDTGATIWELPIVGKEPYINEGHAVATNPLTGALVAVGVVQNDRTSVDIAVISIREVQREAQEEWRQIVTGSGKTIDRDDGALAMAVDSRQNVVLAGYAQKATPTSSSEFRVAKIGKDGNVAWKYDLKDSALHLTNAALAVALDSAGSIFAAGRTCGTSSTTCFTVVKVSKNGKEVWRTTFPDRLASKLILDPDDGNVIVAGWVRIEFVGDQFLLTKLNANTGDVMWSAGMENSRLQSMNGFTATGRNTALVAGDFSFGGTVGWEEYDRSTGALVSSHVILEGPGGLDSLAPDQDGNVIAALHKGSDQESDFFVAKFDPNGTALWTNDLGSRPLYNIAVEAGTGDIAVGGHNFIARIASNGFQEWQWNAATDGKYLAARNVAFAAGRVVSAGQTGDGKSTSFVVTLLSCNGTEQWRRTYGGDIVELNNEANALVVVETRKGVSIFAAGRVRLGETGRDMFAAGLSIDGSDLPVNFRLIAYRAGSARHRSDAPQTV